MNLSQIIHKIKEFSASQKFIKTVTDGDVYEKWNGKPSIEYGCLNVDVTNVQRSENLSTYTVYLYYADRLLQDNSNEYEVKSTAELVLTNIINYCGEYLGDIEPIWTITFFNQQFADNLAGGYVSFQLEVKSELGICTIDDYDE